MSRPIRLLVVNHVARISGAEKGLLDILSALDRRRFAAMAVLPHEGELADALRGLNVRVNYVPMQRFRRTRNPVRLFSYTLDVRSTGRRLAELIADKSADIVHANSNIAQVYAGPAAKRAGVPSIWHSRDLVELGFLGRWMMRYPARIVAISNAVAKHLDSYNPHEGRITMIHNAVDLKVFSPAGKRRAVRREMGIGDDTFVAAAIGQLVPWKCHSDFLEAAALMSREIPNVRFLVVGSDLFGDNSDYAAGLRKSSRDAGIEGNVTFTGRRDDIPAVLEAIDVLIHPACREPFGRVVAEAMAMAKPVIAVDACGPAEIIDSGVTGILVPPNNPLEIAAAAAALWRDPDRAEGIGSAARKRIRSNFGLDDFIKRMQSVYEDALNTAAESRP